MELLNTELIVMGTLCENALEHVMQALQEDNDALNREIIILGKRTEEKEREVENICINLLLKQQPVASDLRQISAALKMITDMERVGDQASDIAEISRYIIESGMSINDDIRKMAKEAIKMVTDSVDSFVKKDLELARKVIAYDDVVDEWFAKLKSDVIEMIAKDSTNGEYYIDIIMIAKYLERIGDHATNIAEWVEYSITGVRSKNN